jgi:beta-glucosidase
MRSRVCRLYISGLITLSAFCVSGKIPADQINSAVTPIDRNDKNWWQPRHAQVLERVAKGNVGLIFIGDSITHRWETIGSNVWKQYYEPRNAANLGFGGDRTEHVLWRLQNGEIDGISPKLAVLLIGTNNTSHKDSADQIADGIKAICAELRRRLPETKILMLSIFPRGGSVASRKDKSQKSVAMNSYWNKNNRASQMASELADNKTIFFLDINRAFLNEDGALGRDVMPDLIHPGEEGYQRWAEAMEPTIKKLLGE